MLLPLYLNSTLFFYWAQNIWGHISLAYKLSSQQAEFISCYITYSIFKTTLHAVLKLIKVYTTTV